MMMTKKIFAAFAVAGVLLSQGAVPANAAYTVKPRAGQCFMYTTADVSAPFATKNPVSCSGTHNAETYLVTKWPISTKPGDMSDEDALNLADSLCQAWGDYGLIDNPYFNFWAWYTPNDAQWAKGERWLRCDAMRTLNKKEPRKYASWKGLKLGSGNTI
jgi:hypothetical protein